MTSCFRSRPLRLVCLLLAVPFLQVLSLTSLATSDPATKVVIATGIGTDVESAAKNAAEKALTQVVGTFIDAEKLLEKNAEIKAGIRSETKRLSTRISSYSQGSIESLEVLSATQEGGLYRVKAKVAVRIEDFTRYIRESVLAEREVRQGLLAQIKTKESQTRGLTDLLGKVFTDAKNYSVVVPSVGDIKAVEDPQLEQELNTLLPGDGYLIEIPVMARLDENFLANARRIFDETAENKYRGMAVGQMELQTPTLVVVTGSFLNANTHGERQKLGPTVKLLTDLFGHSSMEFYLRRSVNQSDQVYVQRPSELVAYSYPTTVVARVCTDLQGILGRGNSEFGRKYIPNIDLRFIDHNGRSEREELLVPEELIGAAARLVSGESLVPRNTFSSFLHFSWRETDECVALLNTQSSFSIYSRVTEDLLRNTERIQVRFTSAKGR